jgi:hypothetical protein
MKPLFNAKGSSPIASTSVSTSLVTVMLRSPLHSHSAKNIYECYKRVKTNHILYREWITNVCVYNF